MGKVVMKKIRRKGFREKRKEKNRSEELCGNLDFRSWGGTRQTDTLMGVHTQEPYIDNDRQRDRRNVKFKHGLPFCEGDRYISMEE
jgi:hypothetical protein